MTIEIGAPAPDFSLKNQHGETITLSELRGAPVLLVFYPFAFSGICTGELCELRDNLEVLEELDVRVLGISCDTMYAQRIFAEQDGYTFDLLSDFWPHGEVAKAYGIFAEGPGAAARGSYLVDAEGVLRWKVENGLGEARDLAAYRAAIENLSA